jgi:hypothetical protein
MDDKAPLEWEEDDIEPNFFGGRKGKGNKSLQKKVEFKVI